MADIFYAVGDCIKEKTSYDYSLPREFKYSIMDQVKKNEEQDIDIFQGEISQEDYDTIIVQLKSHDLIKEVLSRKYNATEFRLTEKGEKKLLTKYFVRTKK